MGLLFFLGIYLKDNWKHLQGIIPKHRTKRKTIDIETNIEKKSAGMKSLSQEKPSLPLVVCKNKICKQGLCYDGECKTNLKLGLIYVYSNNDTYNPLWKDTFNTIKPKFVEAIHNLTDKRINISLDII
ncbi:MAG: hypothetical protein IIA48_11770 [Bacteroidetes bacterium]|nr:hypothetical protein [Bacteroidota bacterium]